MKMKIKNLWLVMLVIALAFGMMAACGGEEEEEEEEEPVVDHTTFPPTYRGTYACSYKQDAGQSAKTIVETIEFGSNFFNISDNEKADKDYLNFTIKEWWESDAPAASKDKYPKGIKFTGVITKQKGYVPSNYTVPTSTSDPITAAADVKEDGSGPEFSMYIYFDTVGEEDDEGNIAITFIRTAFSKKGDNKAIVSNYQSGTGSGQARTYFKKK